MTPDQARQVIQEALTQVAPDADIAGLDAGRRPVAVHHAADGHHPQQVRVAISFHAPENSLFLPLQDPGVGSRPPGAEVPPMAPSGRNAEAEQETATPARSG